MTADQLLAAVNAAELTPQELTILLAQAKGTLQATKLRTELAAIDVERTAALAAFEAAKQAKQVQIAAAETALAQVFGVGAGS